MTKTRRRSARALALPAALVGISATTGIGPAGSFVSPARAIIGRPLTPMSYAGVARRTTVRAGAYGAYGTYGAAAAAGAATAAAVASQPTVIYAAPPTNCVRFVDAYGTVTYRCP